MERHRRHTGWGVTSASALAAFLFTFGVGGPLAPPAQAARLAGAIFTTTPDGGIVNENVHYQSKLEVYLDGGPGPNAPQTAAGLPDGDYVFQVTNPSGWVQLSEDPAKCRIVEVYEGVIIRIVPPSEYGLSNDYTVGNGANAVTHPCHILDGPDGAAGASGHHDTNTDLDHGPPAIVVQLMPFYDTPNPGGVYKAWMIPVGRYEQNGGDLDAMPITKKVRGQMVGFRPDPGFGPPRDQSKTDNFKVREAPPALEVRKFHDLNGNGQWDAGEPEIGVDQCVDEDGHLCDCNTCGGWLVSITEPLYDGGSMTMDRFTPVFEEVVIGTILVSETLYGEFDWAQSHLSVDGIPQPLSTDIEVLFTDYAEQHSVVYGNYMPVSICGKKFHDLDGDGVRDANEPGLAGVTITLTGTDGKGMPVSLSTTTDAAGAFCFNDLRPGDYSVAETVPTGYVASTVTSVDVPPLTSGQSAALGWVFGNLQPAAICGEKFHDLNGNGQWDSGELGLAGVIITLTRADGPMTPQSTTTDSAGRFCFSGLWPGSYLVEETVPAGYQPSTAISSGPHTLISGSAVELGWVFGNYQPASLCGKKFEDLDADGQHAMDEPGLAGVTVTLTGTDGKGNPVSEETLTGAGGLFCFSGLEPGWYTVTETVAPPWYPSTAISSGPHELQSGDDLDLMWVFGNYRLVSIDVHKFFDLDTDGVPDPGESDLEGIEFCLYESPGLQLISCQLTDADGMAYWTDLMPGSYLVVETLPSGFFATTPVELTVSLQSGDSASLEFGNVADCDGLTPGYWKNWRNHYTVAQFESLLAGTIAPTIAEADAIFADYDASPDNEMTILRAMLLANQLTIALTQHPALPNPSDGSLFSVCQVQGASEDLGYWLDAALAIHAVDGVGFDRAYIIWVKDVLDWFANLRTDLSL